MNYAKKRRCHKLTSKRVVGFRRELFHSNRLVNTNTSCFEHFFDKTSPNDAKHVCSNFDTFAFSGLGRFHASLSVLKIVLERSTTPIHNGAGKGTLLFEIICRC